jgi:uncharacterized Zn-finger protein
MKHIEVIYVNSKEKIKCDGDVKLSPHPKIYLDLGKKKQVTCGYCGKTFIAKDLKDNNE